MSLSSLRLSKMSIRDMSPVDFSASYGNLCISLKHCSELFCHFSELFLSSILLRSRIPLRSCLASSRFLMFVYDIYICLLMFIDVSPLGRSPHLENGLVGVSDTLQGVEIQVFRQTWLGVHLVIWTLRSVHHLAYLSISQLPSIDDHRCMCW